MQNYNFCEINNSIVTDSFNDAYLPLCKYLNKQKIRKSRNGDTKETLEFKTTIKHPNKRFVGGCSRNMNPFFLMAEAFWIWNGGCDLEFLSLFNKGMRHYSDNGEVFHAPYGYRLRNWGYSSDVNRNKFKITDRDQIYQALKVLFDDEDSRRVVLSIWNPMLDLNFDSKDIPCNNTLMFKIREGKFYLSVLNRSNDLHLGLPTNVFQFSFIMELMLNILNVKNNLSLGNQTHFSQSLHYYLDNPIHNRILTHKFTSDSYNLYSFTVPTPIDINLESNVLEDRLNYYDKQINDFIFEVLESHRLDEWNYISSNYSVNNYSEVLFLYKNLLKIYVKYGKTKRNDADRESSCYKILNLLDLFHSKKISYKSDFINMALNFFIIRIKNKEMKKELLNFIENLYIEKAKELETFNSLEELEIKKFVNTYLGDL